MLKIALTALAVALGAAAYTDAKAAQVEYRRDNYGDIVGSDGSRAHRFGSSTYIEHPDGTESKCRRTFDDHVTCEDR